MAKRDSATPSKPRVVFDPKMPAYEYRDSGSHSLSVDRRRSEPKRLSSNLLANVKLA